MIYQITTDSFNPEFSSTSHHSYKPWNKTLFTQWRKLFEFAIQFMIVIEFKFYSWSGMVTCSSGLSGLKAPSRTLKPVQHWTIIFISWQVEGAFISLVTNNVACYLHHHLMVRAPLWPTVPQLYYPWKTIFCDPSLAPEDQFTGPFNSSSRGFIMAAQPWVPNLPSTCNHIQYSQKYTVY